MLGQWGWGGPLALLKSATTNGRKHIVWLSRTLETHSMTAAIVVAAESLREHYHALVNVPLKKPMAHVPYDHLLSCTRIFKRSTVVSLDIIIIGFFLIIARKKVLLQRTFYDQRNKLESRKFLQGENNIYIFCKLI